MQHANAKSPQKGRNFLTHRPFTLQIQVVEAAVFKGFRYASRSCAPPPPPAGSARCACVVPAASTCGEGHPTTSI